MNAAELLEARAKMLYEDMRRRDMKITQESVEHLAERVFAGAVPHAEQAEVIQRALEMHAKDGSHQPEEKAPMKLNTPAVRELALEFFRSSPTATATQALAYVRSRGEMEMKGSSFKSMVVPQVRKQLGISGGAPRSAGAASEGHKAPEADAASEKLSPEKTRELAAEYFQAHPDATSRECYAHLVTLGAPSVSEATFLNHTGSKIKRELGLGRGKPGVRKQVPAKKKAAGAKKRAQVSPAKEAAPDQSATAAGNGPSAEAENPATPKNGTPKRGRISIATPVGHMDATPIDGGLWNVELARIDTDLLNALIVDLVEPTTGAAPA